MHAQFLRFVKTLIKSSLDNYVLPGTLSGSEIMWLYANHWKRNFELIIFASCFFYIHTLKARALNTFISPQEFENRDTQVPVEGN